MKDRWEKIAGMAVISPLNAFSTGGALAYITKGLPQGAMAYEVSKFGKVEDVYISPMARMDMLRARAFGRVYA